jgi:CHAT domain-containing protein
MRVLDQYRYQVFATHGILDNEVPYIKEPALVLCQVGVDSKDRDNDGFLTMTEVMNLKLNAEVVALTVCNTGVGKNLTGEGVMGMGRAFQYAGAKSVLISLWSVENESTNLLTEKFFTHLNDGKDKLESLRLARKDIREAGYEHPFFWAPFILVGDR